MLDLSRQRAGGKGEGVSNHTNNELRINGIKITHRKKYSNLSGSGERMRNGKSVAFCPLSPDKL